MCKEKEINDAYEASVNNVVDAIMDEQGPIADTDAEFIGDVIIGVVRRRLGDISVDAAGVSRSAGDQFCVVRDCAQTFAENIKEWVNEQFK